MCVWRLVVTDLLSITVMMDVRFVKMNMKFIRLIGNGRTLANLPIANNPRKLQTIKGLERLHIWEVRNCVTESWGYFE